MSAVATLVSPALAVDLNAVWPDLNLPGFRVTPFITQRVEYESNVFQTPNNEQDDVIFRTIPGILVELPLGRHRLDFGARMEVLRFADLDSQDTEHYFLFGTLSLDFPGGLRAALKEDLAYTSDPPGTELTGRIESLTNVLSPSVEYAFARRWALGADYVWTHVDFDRTVNQLDRDEHTFGITGFYKVAPKTDLLLNLAYGTKEFSTAGVRDVERYIGVVGLRGEITPRLTSTFRIGWEVREPDNPRRTSYSGIVAGGDWVFQPTDRTRFTLTTERFVAESVYRTNLFYVANFVTFAAEHKFTPKLLVTGNVFGGTNEYPDKAGRRDWRRDEIYGAGLGLDYQIQRWLAVGADYTYTRRYSNFAEFDYEDNIVGAKVTLSF
ncbi:MAG: outer membrane beta-barrel protein [Candidatus Rokuibacteriota bacterium]